MYVVSILFLVTGLVFGQIPYKETNPLVDAGGNGGPVTTIDGVTVTSINVEKIAKEQKADIEKIDSGLQAMGITPSLCDNCKDDVKQAEGYLKNLMGNIEKISSGQGSCANPLSKGTSNWGTIIQTDVNAQAMKLTCCATMPINSLDDVQKAYSACSGTKCASCDCSSTDNKPTCCNNCTSKSCYANYILVKTKVGKQLDINKKKCKSHSTSTSSLAEIMKYLTSLGMLAEQIFGHKNNTTNNTTPTVNLKCDEKCANQHDNEAYYTACLCATTQTLADGSSQRCLPESKCTADTTCEGIMKTMQAQKYCSGSDCEDVKQSCICSKISETTGVSKVWDPASGICVPTGSGPDNNNTTPKYPGAPTTPTTPTETTPTGTDTPTATGSPVGTGSTAGSSMTSPGSGLNKSAPANDKDKAKFSALSKGTGSGQYKPASNQYGAAGNYGGPDATTEGGIPSENAKDIVKQTDADIWKIVRDIYQTGIDANRFMDPNAVAVKEKANVKKGTKKAKGKKA